VPIGNRVKADPARPAEQNRKPRGRARALALATGFALGVVASAAAVLCFMPRAGQIAVNVADSMGSAVPNLFVYIDGKRRCDSAPCVVPDVAAGSHTVRVEASGFEPPADMAVAVESRKGTIVDFSLAPASNGGTGIRVTGTQPGTELFVDDQDMGPLPQSLHDMTPGSHKVKIAGSERYAPVEKTVTISRNELQDLGTVTLKVIKGKATLSIETPGAKALLASGSDHWELPALPISVDIDTSKRWLLMASKPGFNDYNQPISFDDGQAEKVFTVALDPKVASAAFGNPSPPADPQPTLDVGAAARQAFLKINSIPASSVMLDGKPIGSTPKLKYRVSPGTHSLVFVNPDRGFKKQISVTVSAGETKAAISRN
jgi:serine/threonine-protein kinase